jgi:hypothetical protein
VFTSLQLALGRALLQTAPEVDVSVGEGLVGGAISAFLTTLLVGAILVAVAPGTTDRLLAAVADEPIGNFLSGLLSLVAIGLLAIVLVITIVGILVAIPILIVAYLLWAVGATVAFLAIAIRLVDREDGWLVPLLLAAALNGCLTLTGIGGLVSLLVGMVGFGAVLRDVLG